MVTERPQGSVWGPGPRQSGLMTAEHRLRYTERGPGTIHAVVTRKRVCVGSNSNKEVHAIVVKQN